MTLTQGDGEGIKYEVRSTKYEVKELGATELRGHGGRRQSKNDVWGLNPCTRDVEAHLVRRASVPRMGTSIAAILENFIGTAVVFLFAFQKKACFSLFFHVEWARFRTRRRIQG